MGGGGDDVAVLEGTGSLPRGHQSADVGHVHHEQGAIGVGNGPEAGIVQLGGVGGVAADDHGWLEEVGLGIEGVVVNETSGGGYPGGGERGHKIYIWYITRIA